MKQKTVKEYNFITESDWWKNMSTRKGLPKGHPFIDREWKGALRVTEDSIEKPEEPIKNMTEEELKAMINDDDIINMDDKSLEIALDEALDEAHETEKNAPQLPPANDNNKMVNQLDDVTKESEEKATEIFDIIEVISSDLMDKEEQINENIEITN